MSSHAAHEDGQHCAARLPQLSAVANAAFVIVVNKADLRLCWPHLLVLCMATRMRLTS